MRNPFAAAIALTLLVTACSEPGKPEPQAITSQPTVDTTTVPDMATSPFQAWLGEWTGVEGTALSIEAAGVGYQIVIRNLDGPITYTGVGKNDRIEFERDGKIESIRATDGEGTGMKWLADKKTCLVVNKSSEGFCRG